MIYYGIGILGTLFLSLFNPILSITNWKWSQTWVKFISFHFILRPILILIVWRLFSLLLLQVVLLCAPTPRSTPPPLAVGLLFLLLLLPSSSAFLQYLLLFHCFNFFNVFSPLFLLLRLLLFNSPSSLFPFSSPSSSCPSSSIILLLLLQIMLLCSAVQGIA